MSTTFVVILGLGYACIESASTALFVAQLGWQALPAAFLLTALFILGGSAVYGHINRRVQPETLLTGLTMVLFTGAVLFWALVWLTESPSAIFVLFAWSATVRSTMLAIFWMIGKRMTVIGGDDGQMGSISLWGLLSQAAGFFLVFAVIRYWTAIDLIFISAVAYGLAVLFVIALLQMHNLPATVQPPKLAKRFVLQDQSAKPVLYLAPLSMLLTMVVHYFITYIFLASVETQFSTAEELVLLISAILGSATLVTIVIKRWVVPPLWQRWGMPVLLIALPVTFLFFLIAGSVLRWAAPQPLLLLSSGLLLPVSLYWLDSAVRYILFGPDDTVLHRFLASEPNAQRTLTSCVISATAGVLAGLTLLVIQASTAVPLTWVGSTLIAAAGLWFLVNLALARNYPQLLSASLRQQESEIVGTIRVDAFDRPDKSALDTLEHALNDSSENVQLYAIERLTNAAPARLYSHLPDLLSSPHERVRMASLQSCRTLTLREFAPRIANMVHSEPSDAARVEAVRALATIEPGLAIEATREYLSHDVLDRVIAGQLDLELLVTTLIVASRFGDESTYERADTLVAQMIDSTEPSVRVAAARILSESGRANRDTISRLLHDPETQVRDAALQTAGTINDPALLPDILGTMADASLCAKAQTLLFQAGVQAIPLLEEALLDPSLDRSIRVALIEVCGAVDDSRTTALLLAQINDPHDDVRSTALTALQRLNYRAGRYMQKRLIDQTTDELREAAQLLTISHQVRDYPKIDPDAASLLLRAMEQGWLCRRDNALHRMIFLSAPRPIGDAIENLHHVDARRRHLATEILMVSLSEEQQQIIKPFLADLTLQERVTAVRALFPQPERSIQASLLSIKEMGLRSSNDWLRSCAAYTLATVSDSEPATPFTDMYRLESERTPESREGPYALPDALSAGESTMLKTIQRVLFLRSVDLFRSVPDDVLAWVAEAAVEVYIPRGQRFITQGEHGDALFIVISGFTDIVIDNKGMVATRGPKSVFGEMGVLTSQPRTASCIANTEITALKLERRDFQELMTRTPQLALGIIDVLVQRLDDVSQRAAAPSADELAADVKQ